MSKARDTCIGPVFAERSAFTMLYACTIYAQVMQREEDVWAFGRVDKGLQEWTSTVNLSAQLLTLLACDAPSAIRSRLNSECLLTAHLDSKPLNVFYDATSIFYEPADVIVQDGVRYGVAGDLTCKQHDSEASMQSTHRPTGNTHQFA